MNEAERLAERLSHFPQQVDAWLAAEPPIARAAEVAGNIDLLVKALQAALSQVDQGLADLQTNASTVSEKIVDPIDTLIADLTAAWDTLSTEGERVATLLDPLDRLQTAATHLDDEADAMTNAMTEALGISAERVETAEKALVDRGARAITALESNWHNLSQAFAGLDTAFDQAIAEAKHQTEAVIPNFGAAAETLGRDALAGVTDATTREIEEACRQALARVRGEVERALDDAIATLAHAIRGFGDDAGARRGNVEDRARGLMSDVQAIFPLGEQVAAEALRIPFTVAMIIARRLTGGLL